MLKQIDGYLKFADSAPGDTERDAFAAALDTELSGDHVVPSIVVDTSYRNNESASKTIIFKIMYSPSNGGIAAFNTFWDTCSTELAKATVLSGSLLSKCDNLHDANKPVANIQTLSK